VFVQFTVSTASACEPPADWGDSLKTLPLMVKALQFFATMFEPRSTYEAQLPILLKRERERYLERERLARKKASKNQGA
jgi:hypothetical protein